MTKCSLKRWFSTESKENLNVLMDRKIVIIYIEIFPFLCVLYVNLENEK